MQEISGKPLYGSVGEVPCVLQVTADGDVSTEAHLSVLLEKSCSC